MGLKRRRHAKFMERRIKLHEEQEKHPGVGYHVQRWFALIVTGFILIWVVITLFKSFARLLG